MGAYPRASDMRSLPISRKYEIRANVLVYSKQSDEYAAIAYCSNYLKYDCDNICDDIYWPRSAVMAILDHDHQA
jgi:hypothetical protein